MVNDPISGDTQSRRKTNVKNGGLKKKEKILTSTVAKEKRALVAP